MNKLILIAAVMISIVISSCTQTEIDSTYNEESLYIDILYSEFNINIYNSISKQTTDLGMEMTRAGSDNSIVGIMLTQTQEELQNYTAQNRLDQLKQRQDSIFTQFFSLYSDEDYLILNKSLKTYISNGGHNKSLLNKICKDLPKNLVEGYVYMCANADNLASENIMYWLDDSFKLESEMQISHEMNSSAIELYCRQGFWDKIRLIALASGSEYLTSMACGALMPEADALVTIADVVGAGAAAFDYYACCKKGIS